MTFINRAAKQCDYCTLAPAILYCRNDAAFMCMACDARVHVGTAGAKHTRVLTCEVCEQAPADVTCKADATSLCVICDRDIHAANPLASRHQRVAVVPFFETAETLVMKSADVVVDAADVFPAPLLDDVTNFETWGFWDMRTTPGDVTVPSKFIGPVEMKSLDCLLADSEALFGIDGFDGFGSFADSVVPVQNSETSNQFNDYSAETGFEIDFSKPNISSYNSYTTKPCISVSSSSIDVCVVPDTTAFSEISLPYMKNPIVITDPNQGSQVIGMDREARVMRYREKKKNRKFEKTVRYASRKAYAETRPRVKGRFAKKTDTMSEMDQMFGDGSFHFDIDDKFGVVPSF